MAKFLYTVTTKEGKSKTDSTEATSREEAASQVRKDGWFIVSLKKEKEGRFSLPFFGGKNKLSSLERIVFTDHLVAMFKSGISLVEALETYGDEENKRKRAIFEEMAKKVASGKKLSEAMAAYPAIFPLFYLALIKSGELTGNLEETLEYLSKEFRREHEFHEKIKSALIYPILVLIVAFGVVTFLTLVVIPKITEVTKSFGGNLPLVTRIVAQGASFLTAFGPILLLSILGLVFALFIFLKNRSIKGKLDSYLLRITLIGTLLKKYTLARFLRILGSCIKYGVPLSSAFSTAEEVVGITQYRQACKRLGTKIIKGTSLSNALSQEDRSLFPRIVIQAIKGAEKTGHIEEVMLRLSYFYEDEIDRELKRIVELIEPALVIVLGIIVAAIAISVIAPIYQMTSRIK